MTDNHGELILYRTDDGRTDVHLRAEGGTVWLTQAEMAALFETSPQNVTQHIQSVYEDGEIDESATCKDYLQVRREGNREVRRSVKTYRLELIMAVGFRVRSPRGGQFRRWAADALSQYLVKGFLLNDERLKDAERADYFKELLRRIRDIRSSEKRFYQTLRDLFKLSSSDYDGTTATAKTFFATIQNKLVYAITGCTAAQLIVERADPGAAQLGLTNWSGEKPRKSDAVVSKNYLSQPELEQLNRLVTMFLDFAEDRAERRIETRMADWIKQTDRFLDFNERAILDGPGRVSNQQMEAIITERYKAFDASRRAQEKLAADAEAELDMQLLQAEAKRLSSREQPV
ncbi:RhuM family protein [Stenotrophomonas sp. PD6]|uniref:RhuM family protein n=1 Tax=Stenotrophomonas sp. PD6 TaxID=3368612 RepID=UPI003B9F1217